MCDEQIFLVKKELGDDDDDDDGDDDAAAAGGGGGGGGAAKPGLRRIFRGMKLTPYFSEQTSLWKSPVRRFSLPKCA